MKTIKATLGNNEFELQNLREVNGHDDSIPFKADMFFNGEFIGTASNDGWGADANICISQDIDIYFKQMWDSFCKDLTNVTWMESKDVNGNKTSLTYDISFLADCMAYQAIDCNLNEFDWTL